MDPCAILPLTQPDDVTAAVAPLAGEAPLVRVVRSALEPVPEARVVVATTPALREAVQHCLSAAGLQTKVAVTPAAGSRNQALRAGLKCLEAQPHTFVPVLVCDHRYPLSPGAVADRVLEALRGGCDVAVPTLPVTDTVKTVDDLGSVLSTVDRSTLHTVQYPRGFTASALWQLISVSSISASGDVDEFEAALRAGHDVETVTGDADAFHVELPRDAHLLEAIIASRRE
jgi:2-C-methyl-D-erythritol 4-phosphate cytidylyltransferase